MIKFYKRAKETLSYCEKVGVFTYKKSAGNHIKAGDIAGTRQECGNSFRIIISVTVKGISQRIFAHKIAWFFIYDEIPTRSIDHKDRNAMNNKKDNLRLCTQSQNCMNKGIQSNNKSKVTGVMFDKKRNKWRAYINLNRKQIHLGRFDKKEDAVQARYDAQEKYFGEFDVRFKVGE